MAQRKAKKANTSPRKVARPLTSDAPQDCDVFLIGALSPLSRPAPLEREITNGDVFVVNALPADWDASPIDAPLDDSDVAVFAPLPFTPGAGAPIGDPPPDFVMQALDLDPDTAEACGPWRKPVTLPAAYHQTTFIWECSFGCVGLMTPSHPDGQHAPDCEYWAAHPTATPF